VLTERITPKLLSIRIFFASTGLSRLLEPLPVTELQKQSAFHRNDERRPSMNNRL